ncbi:MAG: M24 family metallopeptidase [Ignisphaera sp.]
MTLLRLKMNKLEKHLSAIGIDVDFVVIRSREALKYMVSELYSPPPEEVPVHRIAVDIHTGLIEFYVSPLEYYRVKEVYGNEGIDVWAVTNSCIDLPSDMKCYDRNSLENVFKDKLLKYKRIAVDDPPLCEDMVCIDIRQAIRYIRRSKSIEEVEIIKRATEVTEKSIELAASLVKQGLSEIAIASILERLARELGAEGFAFSTIVAVGENTAKPHHIPSHKIFSGAEPILIDFGVRISGYVSDVTRILIPSNVDKNYVELVQVIDKARLNAIIAIKSGLLCSDIDFVARSVLRTHNIHQFFIHGLGHGVGVDVHEGPRLGQASKDYLIDGDVVTVEPGVYIHGKYGVRIEDLVLVDKDGVQVLSEGPKVIEI